MADEPKPTARHDYPASKFPITYRLYSGKTGALLWEHTVNLDEARQLARVEVPGYADTEHYPVRAEIRYGDGTSTTQVMQ
ncbi:MAG TPA: hypothetical protein VLE97_08660 [Gaiellaceae bacterium]|nr:hypothetical protein [Gaiellaceae bacterium]